MFNFNFSGLDGHHKVTVNGKRVKGWSRDGSTFIKRDTVYINACSTKTYCQDRSEFKSIDGMTCSDIAALSTGEKENSCTVHAINKNCPVTCETGCQCFDAVEKFDFRGENGYKPVEIKCSKAGAYCAENIIRSRCPVKCGVCTAG